MEPGQSCQAFSEAVRKHGHEDESMALRKLFLQSMIEANDNSRACRTQTRLESNTCTNCLNHPFFTLLGFQPRLVGTYWFLL